MPALCMSFFSTFHDSLTCWLSCVEVGCGSGYVICSAARLLEQHGIQAHCIASDISTAALTATQETLLAHSVSAGFPTFRLSSMRYLRWDNKSKGGMTATAVLQVTCVDLVHGDLLSPFLPGLQHKVDLLVRLSPCSAS